MSVAAALGLRAKVAAAFSAGVDRLAAKLPPGLSRRLFGPRHGLPVAEVVPAAGPDRLLSATVLALAAFGVVMVFSAGAMLAAKTHHDWTFFLKRQGMYAVAGFLAFWFGVRVDYAHYRRLTYPLLLVSLVMLVAVLVVGSRAGGAIRWFRIGPISFQPSEMAKFSVVLYLASLLARKAEQVRSFSMGFLPPMVVTGVVMALLLKQPDLGTALIFGVVALAMLFVAGTRTSYIILAVLCAAPVGWHFIVGTPFRMRRMMAFLNPEAYRSNEAYQVWQSLVGIGSGGLFGRGLGAGRQKLEFLPEAHTDFIAAVIGEELGLVGLLGVVVAFGILMWRGFLAAARARDVFGAYLAFGLTATFGLQAFFNLAVAMSLLPAKGLPLPFISYGGTSLVVSLFSVGVLANISARNPEPRPMPFWAAFHRGVRGHNRRAEDAPRIIVEVGPAPSKVRPESVT